MLGAAAAIAAAGRRRRELTLALAAVAAPGCSRASDVGPSPVAAAPSPGTMAAPPAGVDPAYVRMLARLDASGRPQRWEGGPFHHCFGAGLEAYRGQLEAIADRVSALSGIPRTSAGPCNVEWIEDPAEPKPATTYASGTATAIVKATVRIQRPADLFGPRPGAILHEGGHVLGLAHSDRRTDVMHPEVVDADFSADELAVLAWMYGR